MVRFGSGLEIFNSVVGEVSKCRIYNTVNHPLVDEHAFPSTGFVVAWLSCSLQKKRFSCLCYFLLKPT